MGDSEVPSVAILGCGYWGKNLVRNFAQLNALQMVCEPSKAGQTAARQIAPQCTLVTDVKEVWQSPIQGVVIATPAVTHYELVGQALEAEKDVFVEIGGNCANVACARF